MSKIVLTDTAGGFNIAVINDNFDEVANTLQNKVLYRDNPTGEPNNMESDLDMDGHRIYNLPEPLSSSEAARLQDVQNALQGAASANLISFTPYLDISSTNVQGAIQEIADDLLPLASLPAKVNEVVSITDFGTIGVSAANDTATLVSALASITSGTSIVFPAGSTTTLKMDALPVGGKSVKFIGNGASLVIVAGSSTYVMNITNSNLVSVSGFKNISCTTGVGILFKFDPTSLMGTLVADNNGFSGRVSFIRANGSTTQDPVAIPFGIDTFQYTNNFATDMEISHVVFTDVPIKRGIVHGNKVRNFSYIFMQTGITNATTNGAQLQAISQFDIFDNYVTNDDSHYHVGAAGSYYTFALIECNTVNYSRNHIEGMKTTETVISLYDAYLNCVNVTYTGNTYKNNANFATTVNNNWLIKCKLDSTVSLPTTKVIVNNTFVIEDEWLKRIGRDTLGCSHRLYNTSVTNSGKVTIRNNVFNLHTMYPPDNHYVESFTFSGNEIRCRAQETPGYVLMLSPATAGVSEAVVENNCVHIGPSSTMSLSLLHTATASVPFLWDSVRINNNSVYAPNTAVTSTTFIQGIRANTLAMNGNTSNSSLFSCIYDSRVKNLYAYGNSFIGSKATAGTYPLRLTTLYGRSSCEQSYYGIPGLMFFTVHTNSVATPPSASTLYLVRVRFETSTGVNEVQFKYTLAYSAGVYTVNWVDNAAAARSDIALTAAGDTLLSQQVASGAGSLALTVQFRNTVGETYFRILGVPTTPCKYSISVSVFE